MPVRLGRFEMPKRLTKEDSTATDTYAKFIAEPFETGYGHTVGNSLRRVLLSSLEGAAVTSVKIDGAMHEFTTIEGIVEDVIEIVLNLKKVLLKAHNRDSQTLLLSVHKDGEVEAGDNQLTQASAILQHHLDVFVGYDKNAVEFEEVADKQDDEKAKMKKLLNMSVNEIELSVRAANCLNNANITTVGQLAMKTEGEMLKYR